MLETQHRLNPLHIYCRLRDKGISKKTSMFISGTYEKIIYKDILSMTHIFLWLSGFTLAVLFKIRKMTS